MDYKKLREIFNKSMSSFIISGVFLILGFCFVPLTFVFYKNQKVFNPTCLDAIFMYIIFGVFIVFLGFGIYYLIKYLKAKKSK